jgi:hypothetical protein
MKSHLLLVGVLSLSAPLAACEKDPKPVEVEKPVSLAAPQPISLEGALLYVTKTEDEGAYEALILDVEDAEHAKTTTHELPKGQVRSYPRSAHPGEVLLLTEGLAPQLVDGGAEDAVPSHVLLFDRSGETKRFALAARYGALAVSEDGRFAIAYAPSGTWATADTIAVIDLERAGRETDVPTTSVRALDGQGPSAISFAPPGSPRRLAVLVMTDAVNLIDLEHPELNDKVLPLKLPSGSAALRAKKVLFAGDRCFIQADNSSDVLAVRLEDDDSALGFQATLSTLGTENKVQDIALLEGEGAPRLLALGEGSLRIIDTRSGDSDGSPTTGRFGHVYSFQGSSPFDRELRPRGLLYGDGMPQLGFVDLQVDLPGSERSVELLSLRAGVQKLVFAEDPPLAVIAQADGKISLVNLEERTVSSLSTEGTISELLLDGRSGVERSWVLTSSGSLGSVKLADRTPSQLLLEKPASFIVPVLGEPARLAVGQPEPEGKLLLIDARNPSRSSAEEVADFLLPR